MNSMLLQIQLKIYTSTYFPLNFYFILHKTVKKKHFLTIVRVFAKVLQFYKTTTCTGCSRIMYYLKDLIQ